MLSIYIYSNTSTTGGFLDISPNTSLDLEALADIFDEDLTNGEYSLPIDIPWTDNNRKLMDFSERIENAVQKHKFWRVDVYDDGFPEISNGKLTILEKVGKWSFGRGKFSASIAGTKGLFGSQIKGRKLQKLQLNGPITWSGQSSREFAQSVMSGGAPQWNWIQFAPVAVENFIDTGRSDYTTEFLARDCINNVVVDASNNWHFARPDPNNPQTVIAQGSLGYNDYRTVPFYNFKFVLRKVFEEAGYTVQGAMFDVDEWDDVYIFNQCGIENYSAVLHVDYNRSITPGNHVPNMLQTDFLKAACTFFNMYFTFIGNNTAQFYYRDAVIKNRTIASLNEAVSGDFDSTLQDVDTTSQSGYKISYTWDSSDGYYSERTNMDAGMVLCATITTSDKLATLNIGRPFTLGDMVYVTSENLYYAPADLTTTPIKWECYAENLLDYVKGDGAKSIDTGLSTLCRYIMSDPTTGLLTKAPYVGTRQPGTYINNKGVQVVNPFGLRLFFIGMRTVNGATIPVSYSHNRDDSGNIIQPHSLAMSVDEGIAPNFHKLWRTLNDGMEIVKTSVASNRKVLQTLNDYDCVEIANTQFLPNKIERSIPRKSTLDLYIVPL